VTSRFRDAGTVATTWVRFMDTLHPAARSPHRAIIPLLVLACGIGQGCASDSVPEPTYRYSVPESTGDGWETASLEEAGMDPAPVITMMETLRGFPDHWIHGIVVAKGGRLVFEEYFPGTDLDLARLAEGLAFREVSFGRDSLHSVASVTKSVTSILAGIAIDRGDISGTDAALMEWFPEQEAAAQLQGITLEHALTMTTGIPWDESAAYDDPANDLGAMIWSDRPIAAALQRETESPPGERWVYNSGTTNILGEAIRRATGTPLAGYAREHLFGPLQIADFVWYGFPADPDMGVASSSLYLRPRDMAKLGQLYLDGGAWAGERVVSEEWVARSVEPAVNGVDSSLSLEDPGYGYLWWTGTFARGPTAAFYAAGFGGQFIFVLPDLEMVVAFTGGGFEGGDYEPIRRIVNEFLIPAAGGAVPPE
jgi:CubicO group peptidase (beta-lactamase class C family)